MGKRSLKSLTGVLACAVVAVALLPGSATAKSPSPFLPIHRQYLKLPAGVQPWLPVWTSNGKNIVFRNQLDERVWITGKNGKGTRCVTCGFTDQPEIIGGGGFTYPFRDGKRLFLASKELGATGGSDDPASADAYVLECAPSVLNCESHKYLPVDMSESKGSTFIVQRRTWHLSPDGNHLGWMEVRLDGTMMIVARLERQADRYVTTDSRSVNPAGPTGPDDTSADRWENASQLYELKSFADGGRSILAVGEQSMNTDMFKINLKTGKTTRLTGNKDWDEDGAEAPDGKSQVIASWRTRDRLPGAAWIPELRDFIGLQLGAAFAPYYVSTWEGFQCDLSPWLLPKGGDMNGRLIGQPLDTYSGNRTAANNLTGLDIWSPDSTSVLLQEKLRTPITPDDNADIAQKGHAPNRIAIARIERPGTKRQAVGSSAVGSWAPPAATFKGTMSGDRTATVKGEKGGTATVTYTGGIKGTVEVTFVRFTDDGKTFVDGTMSADGTSGPWVIKAAIEVTGAHEGSLNADMSVNNDTKPLPTKSGFWTAVYDGKKAPAFPELGPCYSKLPGKNRLRLKTSTRKIAGTSKSKVTVKVRANIAGDKRPVQRALVRVGGEKAKTNRKGVAVIQIRGRGSKRVIADAGDTFVNARGSVRLPRH